MRVIATWSGALAGLMMIIVGSMIPSGLLLPGLDPYLTVVSLPSTWQVPALFLCCLVCGQNSGIIAVIAYITVGLFQIPVFSDGGELSYIGSPGFGYLIGFIPAAWTCGYLAKQKKAVNYIQLSLVSIMSLFLLHLIGIINLLIGSILNRWPEDFYDLLFSYSLVPLPSQIALCTGISIIAVILRYFLLIE